MLIGQGNGQALRGACAAPGFHVAAENAEKQLWLNHNSHLPAYHDVPLNPADNVDRPVCVRMCVHVRVCARACVCTHVCPRVQDVPKHRRGIVSTKGKGGNARGAAQSIPWQPHKPGETAGSPTRAAAHTLAPSSGRPRGTAPPAGFAPLEGERSLAATNMAVIGFPKVRGGPLTRQVSPGGTSSLAVSPRWMDPTGCR